MPANDLTDPDDYLMISGIQHYCFCPRQWGLIHLESTWNDNGLTTEGNLIHFRCHDDSIKTFQKDKFTLRGLRVTSSTLKVVGVCDVIEFYRDENGVPLFGHDGLWRPFPIEYKHGDAKPNHSDILQLTAQAIALEEMLMTSIQKGAIFYNKSKHRFSVQFDDKLRNEVRTVVNEMYRVYKTGITPQGRYCSYCKACSLVEVCLPKIFGSKSVAQYIKENIETL